VRGRFADELPPALADAPLAEELARRLPHPQVILGLLTNNVGTVHLVRGELDLARTAFERAFEQRERALGSDHPEVANTLINLGLVEGPGEAREAHLRRALEIYTSAFGPAHPQTLEAAMIVARYVLDPRTARALLRPGCDALERFVAEAHELRARCLASLGHYEAEAGQVALASESWRQARELLGHVGDPESDLRVAQILGESARLGAAAPTVIATLRAEIAKLAADGPWFLRRERGELQLGLADTLGPGPDAAAALAIAIADFDASQAQADDVFGEQCRARAHLQLAELQLDAGGRMEEISGHLDAAASWYSGAGPAYAWRSAAIENLRGRLNRPGAAAAAGSSRPRPAR
jgi:eukaryotic-like serine/threonine-protein kinase